MLTWQNARKARGKEEASLNLELLTHGEAEAHVGDVSSSDILEMPTKHRPGCR